MTPPVNDPRRCVEVRMQPPPSNTEIYGSLVPPSSQGRVVLTAGGRATRLLTLIAYSGTEQRRHLANNDDITDEIYSRNVMRCNYEQ